MGFMSKHMIVVVVGIQQQYYNCSTDEELAGYVLDGYRIERIDICTAVRPQRISANIYLSPK